MTPDIKPSEIFESSSNQDSLSRKLSKSSIDLSIPPSPPLSPYQSNENHISSIIRQLKNNTVQVAVDKSEFPLNKFENSLIVDAWSNSGTKSFKQSQINFIKQYTCRKNKVNKPIVTRKFAPRKLIKNNYNESSYFSNNYNSDSDYSSQFEKVRTRRVVKESSSKSFDNFPDIPSRVSTPVIKKRKPATPSSPVIVNIDWESLPDYSPDVSLLPSNTRCLKVEWKGQPMDLSNDPLVDKLHPAEVILASILRLPCNLYLDSKRRLFMEKVARLKKNLPFRRTDAQKSCRIDVNKASRLFAAFEKIGWLEDDKFGKYL